MKARLLLYFYISFLLALSARAATSLWQNVDGGAFGDISNWSNGVVPGIDDQAIFALTNSYSVQFDANIENNSVLVASGVVTQTLSGFVWSVSGDFRIGQNTAASAKAIVSGGTVIVTNAAGTALISAGDTAGGEFVIRGATAIADYIKADNAKASKLTFENGTLTTLHGASINFPTSVVLGGVPNGMMIWNIKGGINDIANDGQNGYGGLTLGTNIFFRKLGHGILNVSGNGTKLNVKGLDVYGGCALSLTDGAVFNSHSVQWGLQIEGSNSVVVVSGATWLNSYLMYFGMHAGAQTMIITNGGYFRTGGTTYHDQQFHAFSTSTNRIIITGSNSWFDILGPVEMGRSWSTKKESLDNTLVITDGGKFTARGEFVMGSLADAGTIPGPTLWGNLIDVTDGSFSVGSLDFEVGKIRFGRGTGAITNLVIKGGTNSVLEADGRCFVGFHGALQPGGFSIGAADAAVTNWNGLVHVNGWTLGDQSGDNGSVIVVGGSVTCTNMNSDASLIVGHAGVGALRVDAGIVTADIVKVAEEDGSSGSLTVASPGSIVARKLKVGSGGMISFTNSESLSISESADIDGTILILNTAAGISCPATLGTNAKFAGQGSITFAGGLHLPSTDIIVPSGISVQASVITTDGGRLIMPGGDFHLDAALATDNSSLEIRFVAPAGSQQRLWTSDDLQNWTEVSAGTLESSADGSFVWRPSITGVNRYFRVSAQ